MYGNVREHIPQNYPKLLGNTVTITAYVYENLFNDVVTRISVTGILYSSINN